MKSDSSALPLSGVLPVFQTPFHEDETIDFATLEKELDWLFSQEADGIVMAMVSETLRLSTEERRELAAAACKAAAGRGFCVISVSAESSKVAEDLARHAEDCGATAVMAIPPVSIAVLEEELRGYFTRLLQAVKIPVVIQDAAGYVGRPMPIAFQASLLEEFGAARALFKPEAPPIVERFTELRDATWGQALMYEGSGGGALVETFPFGVAGTMPGADLLAAIVPLWKALNAGQMGRARRIHTALKGVLDHTQSLDSYLSVEKQLLVRQGIFKNEVIRGPVGFRLSAEQRASVDRAFEHLLAECAA